MPSCQVDILPQVTHAKLDKYICKTWLVSQKKETYNIHQIRTKKSCAMAIYIYKYYELSPGLPNYDSSSKFSQDQPTATGTTRCAGGLYQFPGLGKFSFSRHDLMNLNGEAAKRTGISSVHHAYCGFGDFCHLFVREIMRSSLVLNSPAKLL